MRIDDLDTIVARGGDELERVYRGDHIIVWEPGELWITRVTGGTLQEGVDYIIGISLYDPDVYDGNYNLIPFEWTLAKDDVTDGDMAYNNFLPLPNQTERQISRSEYETYFKNALYPFILNVDNGKLKLKGTSLYLSLETLQAGATARDIKFDSTGYQFSFGSEFGNDIGLVDNGVYYALWCHYFGTRTRNIILGAPRRSPAPICNDFTEPLWLFKLERRRTYHYE